MHLHSLPPSIDLIVNTMADIKIAIIGAGPSGCALARLLINANINVIVYEGETSANARAQGGTLDLHDKTGIATLKKAGLYDEFVKRARFDGEALVLADKHMTRWINMGGTSEKTSRGRPEIDRSALRQMLVDSLPAGTIKWSHKLRRVDEETRTLHFEHGSASGFDLIVGADGTWTKIRPLLTPLKPYYAGITMHRFGISDAETRYPELHKLVNRGSVFAVSDNKMLTAQQMGDGSLNVGTSLVVPEERLKNISYDTSDLDAVKKDVLSFFPDWDPVLRSFIEVSDHPAWIANSYMLPVGTRWVHKSGFTCIGDAAHVATPYAGEGVNLALEDSMMLADAIIKATRTISVDTAQGKRLQLDQAVEAFEEHMFVRATAMQQMTYDMMQTIFYKEGLPDRKIEDWILRVASDSVPWLLMPLVRGAVYAYYWWFRRTLRGRASQGKKAE